MCIWAIKLEIGPQIEVVKPTHHDAVCWNIWQRLSAKIKKPDTISANFNMVHYRILHNTKEYCVYCLLSHTTLFIDFSIMCVKYWVSFQTAPAAPLCAGTVSKNRGQA